MLHRFTVQGRRIFSDPHSLRSNDPRTIFSSNPSCPCLFRGSSSWIFVVVSLGIAGFGARSVIHARTSSSWPHVSETITHSEIDRSSGSDGTSYAPKVRYAYSVDGQPFTMTRFSLLPRFLNPGFPSARSFRWPSDWGSPSWAHGSASCFGFSNRDHCGRKIAIRKAPRWSEALPNLMEPNAEVRRRLPAGAGA